MILVTGATGKIGRELILDLSARQTPFRALVRSMETVRVFEARGLHAVQGDLERPDTYGAALSDVQTVFLLTAPSSDSVAMERKFLTACKSMGIERVVRVSAVGANPWASSALLRNHGRAEAQLEDSGLHWTILRPTIFMQNLVPFIGPTVSAESTLYAPAGAALMPWVDTRDIAAVAGAVLTAKGHEGLVYEITGPESLSYTHVAEGLSTMLGRQIRYVNVPDGAARQSMVSMGISPWLAEGMITLYHLFKVNGATAMVLETVERLTGRAPRRLMAYLKENEAAFRSPQYVEVRRR
ncbi:NAD(P)-dependent oxidoreductase [Geothrix limicola]|uniref:NAD(P)-dependent oxidoreductase n=1 Tax=Geothrix limicola TaxID=2927978 RepID=A0ABQ5QBJ7_9BACT|nr:SDR family oxidoreductase [Geothrix limicola]GLH71741.1 NAD(P)-dependent oxidoreductase [Geothrix limicola]